MTDEEVLAMVEILTEKEADLDQPVSHMSQLDTEEHSCELSKDHIVSFVREMAQLNNEEYLAPTEG